MIHAWQNLKTEGIHSQKLKSMELSTWDIVTYTSRIIPPPDNNVSGEQKDAVHYILCECNPSYIHYTECVCI